MYIFIGVQQGFSECRLWDRHGLSQELDCFHLKKRRQIISPEIFYSEYIQRAPGRLTKHFYMKSAGRDLHPKREEHKYFFYLFYADLISKLIEMPFLCATFLIKGFILGDMIGYNMGFLSSLETLYLVLELSESCHVTVTVRVEGISKFLLSENVNW